MVSNAEATPAILCLDWTLLRYQSYLLGVILPSVEGIFGQVLGRLKGGGVFDGLLSAVDSLLGTMHGAERHVKVLLDDIHGEGAWEW